MTAVASDRAVKPAGLTGEEWLRCTHWSGCGVQVRCALIDDNEGGRMAGIDTPGWTVIDVPVVRGAPR